MAAVGVVGYLVVKDLGQKVLLGPFSIGRFKWPYRTFDITKGELEFGIPLENKLPVALNVRRVAGGVYYGSTLIANFETAPIALGASEKTTVEGTVLLDLTVITGAVSQLISSGNFFRNLEMQVDIYLAGEQPISIRKPIQLAQPINGTRKRGTGRKIGIKPQLQQGGDSPHGDHRQYYQCDTRDGRGPTERARREGIEFGDFGYTESFV